MKKIIITITEEEGGNSLYVQNEGFGTLEVLGLLEIFKHETVKSYLIKTTESKPVMLCGKCKYYATCQNTNKDFARCMIYEEETK